ncbi:hypothetical protein JTE90_001759 [Oedothorax gibbosus]|uniref:Heme-binding protein 2 n=1 Tax=Oedothorax gibbosus TaxID=931172 RepID=A0AAV6VQN6_9ARAC|nr:hypothetical protein JTE90_001759 [Oedothorax gibbosus]
MYGWIALTTCLAIQILQCWSCEHRGVECIDYEVVARYGEYEERQYPEILWVSVKESGPSLSRSQINLYKKLFRYIQGDNLKGYKEQYPKTWGGEGGNPSPLGHVSLKNYFPWTTKRRLHKQHNTDSHQSDPCREDSYCEPTYVMSMPVPQALKHDLYPVPTDVDLFFEREPAQRYFVRTFGGRPTESQWISEAQMLADLTRKEEGVVRDHYFLNWYDPPLQLFNRLNEVWISKKSNGKKNLTVKTGIETNEVC